MKNNTNTIKKRSNLRETLNQIDNDTFNKGILPYVDTRIAESRGMWRKGWAIMEVYPEALEYQGKHGGDRKSSKGGLLDFSYRMVTEETQRSIPSIKKWIKFAKSVGPRQEDFDIWEIEEREALPERFRQSLMSTKTNSLEIPNFPKGKYAIILADPPWQYDFSATDSRKIENQYDTMAVEDIEELKVNNVSIREKFCDDAVLYLWATAPKLQEAISVMKSWGFKYVTNAVWDKEVIGMGYWFRTQHELILVGTKGNVSPPNESLRISSVIENRRKQYSEKPEEIHLYIEKAFPQHPKLELFARSKRKGWTCWGNEVLHWEYIHNEI